MSVSFASESTPNTVSLRPFSPYLGSREVAVKARQRIVEIVSAGKIATLDADSVAVMTPAFAAECIGGLFRELGEEQLRARVELKNMNESCELLVEALLEHLAGPGSGDLVAKKEAAVEAAVKHDEEE